MERETLDAGIDWREAEPELVAVVDTAQFEPALHRGDALDLGAVPEPLRFPCFAVLAADSDRPKMPNVLVRLTGETAEDWECEQYSPAKRYTLAKETWRVVWLVHGVQFDAFPAFNCPRCHVCVDCDGSECLAARLNDTGEGRVSYAAPV